MHICIYVCVYIYIYIIHTYTECPGGLDLRVVARDRAQAGLLLRPPAVALDLRPGQRDKTNIYIYIHIMCVYIYIYTYVYIYIYTHIRAIARRVSRARTRVHRDAYVHARARAGRTCT